MFERKQVTFYMNSSDYEEFRKRYPNVASSFLRRCVVAAIKSKDFFQHVFFEVSDSLSDSGN